MRSSTALTSPPISLRTLVLTTMLALLYGCASSTIGAPSSNPIAAAVDHPDRLASDRERDAGRKPSEVLSFFGIEPGMRVLDLYSGGGYYTEILAHLVGPTGKVYSHNNQAYQRFAKDELTQRYAGNRLANNVSRLQRENNDWRFPGELDAVLMILTYHDIYYVDETSGWPKIDGPKLLAALCQALQPEGVLGIVDHVATAGSEPSAGHSLHRIDPAIIKREVQASGCFELIGESQILRNPADDHSKAMFDPAVRGKTDRVVLKFVRTAQ